MIAPRARTTLGMVMAMAACAVLLAPKATVAAPQGGPAGGEVAPAKAAQAATAGPFSVARLDWLTGHWEMSLKGRSVEEHWIPPAGGIMIGVGRTLRDGRLVEYEMVVIAERDGKLVYEAHPSGQESAEFTAIQVSDSVVVFENLAHDFPQRVIYRKQGADSLVARVEGTTEKGPRGSDFAYRRAPTGP